MTVILDIFKFLVFVVYSLFLLDSVLNVKYGFSDNDDKERDPFSWLDVVYLAYASFNFILIVKVLHGLQKSWTQFQPFFI